MGGVDTNVVVILCPFQLTDNEISYHTNLSKCFQASRNIFAETIVLTSGGKRASCHPLAILHALYLVLIPASGGLE